MSEQASDFLALTLQERVRRFNLGTPTALHVGTHELVNELWRVHVDMLAALQATRFYVEVLEKHLDDTVDKGAARIRAHADLIRAAIAKATGEA